MNTKKNLFKQIIQLAALLAIVATVFISSLSATSFVATVNHSAVKEIFNQDDQFDKKFREGRDLIDKEEWAKAAVKFSDIVTYPKNKSTDAALYWLAFCQKKQKQYAQTNQTLERLLKEFPASSWADDARVMRMEIAPPLGKLYVSNGDTPYPTAQANLEYDGALLNKLNAVTASTTARTLEGYTFGQAHAATARTPLDREDEIKIAAFQSLLAADPKRAIEAMGELLNADSKASETLKQEILRVVRSPRRSVAFASGANVFTSVNSGVGKQFVPLLRETLVKGFQKESNVKIRKEIIYALNGIGDTESIDYLMQLYASESNSEIKKAIINSFSNSNQNFYAFGTTAATSGAATTRRIELDKLLEIVRTEKDVELRRLAFSNMQRFGNWAADEQTLDALVRLYDAETDEAFKASIIRSFAAAKQAQAAKKLMDIAKNDKSDKLKLEAIYALRTNKSPEVLKFLEDLIK